MSNESKTKHDEAYALSYSLIKRKFARRGIDAVLGELSYTEEALILSAKMEEEPESRAKRVLYVVRLMGARDALVDRRNVILRKAVEVA